MPLPEPVELNWRKALSSGINGCLEMARLPTGDVAVRDSKHPNDSVLVCSAESWSVWVDAARSGELDTL